MASTLELWLLAQFNQRPQLFQKIVLTGSQPAVTLGPIPQQLTNLRLVISAKSDGTGSNGYDSANMQFNGITAANYNWNSWWTTQGGSAMTVSGGTSSTNMQCAEIWNSHFGSAGRGIATIDIPNYSDTNNLKSFTGISSASDGGSAGILQTYTGMLGSGNVAAITSITLLMGAGNFIADSTFSLYGT